MVANSGLKSIDYWEAGIVSKFRSERDFLKSILVCPSVSLTIYGHEK